ncbi:MAG: transporter substrate-binding protein [Hyphomicrobiales bacterium]|nr:transporter substrate-binding protein [Hyphomicrobiales bacterium]
MTRKTLLALAAASVVLLPGSAFAQKVWKHGMVEAKSDAGFVFMAEKNGFAEKQGIKIESMQFKGDALALKALIAGELDSYEGSPGAPMVAISRGVDIRAVGCYWPGLTYAIFTKPEVKSPTELKGKSFGISSPGALPDLFARAVLEKYQIDAKDVQFAAMGSDADRFRAVSAGIIGAAASSSEFTPIAEKLGLKALVHAHDVTPDYVRFCTYMSSKTIASRPDDAAKFLAASILSLRHALKNKAEVVKLTREMTNAKEDDPRAEFVFDEVVRLNAIDPEMQITRSKLDWMENLFVKTGTLTKPIDLDKFIDDSVRQKALAIAGPPKS